MMGANDGMPKISRQPPSVDFIDNRLPKHHRMFQNPPIHYDPSVDRYVSNSNAMAPKATGGGSAKVSTSKNTATDPYELPPRPAYTDIKAMKFWNGAFPAAMDELRTRTQPPKKKAEYNIRDKADWDSVFDILEAARDQYCTARGPVGWLRKVRRRGADKISPVAETARTISTMSPNTPFSTPVLGAIVVILDWQAIKTSSDVRERALSAFDGLVHLFSDVELFLGTFRGDDNIYNAALQLTLCTLVAIERAVGFFTSNEFLRGATAIGLGGQYQESLLQGLQEINIKSEDLMREASKSHIHEFHLYSKQTQQFYSEMLEMQRESRDTGNQTLDAVNSLKDMFNEHIRQRDDKIERMENKLLVAEEHIAYLEAASAFPSRGPSPQPVLNTYSSQEALRRKLETRDIDLIDTAVVNDTKMRLPAKERAQAERVIQATPFRQWLISAVSSKLLVQWDPRPSKSVSGVSSLSAVCLTMSQALRAQPRFISLIWFGGRHANRTEMGEDVGHNAMARSLIDQLLRQHAFDMRFLEQPVDSSIHQEDLLGLLDWLIRQLPKTQTVCCLIDGVVILERDKYEDESLPVLLRLIELVGDPAVGASIKLLLTSTPGSTIVRGAFEEEGLIMNINALSRQGLPPSEQRVARELGAAVVGDGQQMY
ncbi:hypothetical protein BDV12DRAFT_190492 [Aspergillus spectabilis]